MLVSKKVEVDFAHRLINHNGLCKNFHGHRYVFEVFVSGEPVRRHKDSSEGMVIDFQDLKKVLNTVIVDRFDHSMVITRGDNYDMYFQRMRQDGMRVNFVDYISTVENIGKDAFEKLYDALNLVGINLTTIKVWETPTSMAIITKEDVVN